MTLEAVEMLPPEYRAGAAITDKQKALADAILEGLTPTQAAARAGIYINHVARTLKQPVVQSYMAEIRKKAEEEIKITVVDVLNGFKHAIDDAKLQGDPTAQIAGWREIGKMLGYYAPERKKLELSDDLLRLKNRLEDLSEAELLKLASPVTMDGEYEHLPDGN